MTRIYHHGTAVGISKMHNRKPGKRQQCSGWSDAVARRNMRFLWSVDNKKLAGLVGYAFTWTVQKCPDTPQELAQALKLTFEELKRGCRCGPPSELIHYVIEWQKRGVPHVHGVVYFTPENDATFDRSNGVPTGAFNYIIYRWLRQAGQWGASEFGQFVHPVYDARGWSEYVAKHASRGAKHYQRSAASLPAKWQGKTGRMWGKRGAWPVDEPQDVLFLTRLPTPLEESLAAKLGVDPLKFEHLRDFNGFAAFRRLVRSYAISEARKDLEAARKRLLQEQSSEHISPDGSADCRAQSGRSVGQPSRAAIRVQAAERSLSFARRIVRCTDPAAARWMGLSRWVPSHVAFSFVRHLQRAGFCVIMRPVA